MLRFEVESHASLAGREILGEKEVGKRPQEVTDADVGHAKKRGKFVDADAYSITPRYGSKAGRARSVVGAIIKFYGPSQQKAAAE